MNPIASRMGRDDAPLSFRAIRAFPALIGLVIAMSPSPSSSMMFEGDPAQEPAKAKAEVASAPSDSSKAGQRALEGSSAIKSPAAAEVDPIARAKQTIADCKAKYQTVQDYTCTFFKRERIDGKLYNQHIMHMKARTKPASLYFKFVQPNKGREAIYIDGKNSNKIVAHDVGIGRFVAGTMHLDPKGDMAMEENRHPVTEAGLGSMIDLVQARWDTELRHGESVVLFHPQARVGERPCLLVESIHPKKSKEFLFHKVKIYIDREHNLPIRYEAYDWPKHAGAEPELIEEYSYSNLKTNVGLKDKDFDPSNSQYSYGRF